MPCFLTYLLLGSSHLGEVTSMEINSDGSLLLSGSKDNSNRLWETATVGFIVHWSGILIDVFVVFSKGSPNYTVQRTPEYC
jgi:WD40 repeat protein